MSATKAAHCRRFRGSSAKSPTCESRGDGPRQPLRREIKGLGQDPDVVEVLHPAVSALSNDRLGCVGAQPRRRKIEQRGIVDRLETRLHGITEADVDDDRDACAGE
jgi:hypothetical protein